MTHHFEGVSSNQFWQWRLNNCAPATFCTVTELLCVRVGEKINVITPDCLFGLVVAHRPELLDMSVSPDHSPFDAFHRKYAGDIGNGTCGVPSHGQRPKTGCCAYRHYCTYSGFMDNMSDILDGADCLKAFSWKRRSSKLSLGQTLFAHFACFRNQTVTAAGNKLMRDVVGSPPTCLHVSLNHCFGVRESSRNSGDDVLEVLSDWDYAPTLSFKCSKSSVNAQYHVAAVI